MEQWSDRELILIGMILIAFIFLIMIILLISSIVDRHRSAKRLQKIGDDLYRDLERMEDDLQQQYAVQRDELLHTLYQISDGLTSTLNGVSQAQGQQVDAMIRQHYETSHMIDQRQTTMQQITAENLRRTEERIAAVEQTLQNKLNQMDTAMNQLEQKTAQSLEAMRNTVDEKLQGTLEKRLGESFALVTERLEQVYRSLGEVNSLAGSVSDLKRVFNNVKTRGVWGEMQLGNLIAQVLTETQYRCNAEVVPGSGERVEYAIVLPGKENSTPVLLPIDSKFPQEAYLRMADASQKGDQAETEAAQKALTAAVRIEAKRIGKYIMPPHSTDFAVMFLPLEALYAEVIRNSELVETVQRENRVLIAGPSTLLALLNSLQMGFRTLAIEKRSAEVWKLLGAVKHDFTKFADVLKKTQERLQQATDNIDSAFVQTRRIEKRLRDVEQISSDDEVQQLLNSDDGE